MKNILRCWEWLRLEHAWMVFMVSDWWECAVPDVCDVWKRTSKRHSDRSASQTTQRPELRRGKDGEMGGGGPKKCVIAWLTELIRDAPLPPDRFSWGGGCRHLHPPPPTGTAPVRSDSLFIYFFVFPLRHWGLAAWGWFCCKDLLCVRESQSPVLGRTHTSLQRYICSHDH